MISQPLTLTTHALLLEALLVGTQLRELKKRQMQKTAIAIAGGEPKFYLSVIMLGRFEKLMSEKHFCLIDALNQLIDDGFVQQLIGITPETENQKTIIH